MINPKAYIPIKMRTVLTLSSHTVILKGGATVSTKGVTTGVNAAIAVGAVMG